MYDAGNVFMQTAYMQPHLSYSLTAFVVLCLPCLAIAAGSAVNNCMRVALSQLDASQTYTNNSASWIVNRWDSRQDVMATLLATNYISCYSGPTVYTYYRNQPVIDGGYSSGFGQLW
jgi:hypothetical protein